ncbi:macrophage mannose receptor 1 [Syngnathoides biaculeatus]|uniref:macrophage mannose receptor 1 n=1 Tax=Syngnathoides biaculeatus TaxID=300417 RepID=UPI002ADDCBC5|nr:macrophage mannose receptor 1 [Syngnathoides biaculeatus]
MGRHSPEFCSFKAAFCEFHHISLQRSHQEAKAYCRRVHAGLASINDLTDMNRLVASVPDDAVRSWIGLELGNASRWHWAGPDRKLDFLNWKSGEPQGLGRHSCAAMDLQGEWFESECETQRSFVCHIAATSQTSARETPPTTVKTPSNASSSQAVAFPSTAATPAQQLSTGGVSAFTTLMGTLNTTQSSGGTSSETGPPSTSGQLILIREDVTWLQALRYCREHHKDLVHVTGRSIQDRVAQMARNATSSRIWLGLRYACNFDLWFWSGASADCYQNWAPGQGPSSERVSECGLAGAVVTTGGQQWVGLPETQRLNFICQDCAG